MKLALLFGAAVVAALACAVGLDAIGLGWIQSHALGVVIATSVGAAQAFAWPRLVSKDRSRERAGRGAIVAGTTAFLLARAPFGWLDLGAIAAGPPGELPLIVLPAVSVLAVLAALAMPAKRRGASGS